MKTARITGNVQTMENQTLQAGGSAGEYADIIELPHHVSPRRPHMPVSDRAAQFAPFAALTGYGDVIKETARQTDARPELSEDERAELDRKLRGILTCVPGERPDITVTYFRPDERKEGGACLEVRGRIKKVDETAGEMILEVQEDLENQSLLHIRMEDIIAVTG